VLAEFFDAGQTLQQSAQLMRQLGLDYITGLFAQLSADLLKH